MGGKAFTHAVAHGQPTINVQRLNAAEYQRISRQVSHGLQALFPDAQIVIPPTFSSKNEFGDVDILFSTHQAVDWDHVATALGVKAWIDQGSNKAPMCSLAIPLASSSSDTTLTRQYFVQKHVTNDKPAYVTSELYGQVDLSVVPADELHWRSFCSSYSDVGLILGRIGKRSGFKVDTHGLSVVLKEVDSFKDAKLSIADRDGTIFLSGDLGKILKWLRLDMSVLDHDFVNTDDLYTWLDSCVLLTPAVPLTGQDDTRDEVRASSRPVFAGFMVHQAARTGSIAGFEEARHRSRADLLTDAVSFFEKRDEYAVKKADLARKWSNAVANERLKELLAEVTTSSDKSMLAMLRGFRRFVALRDTQPVILERALQDDQSQLHLFLDEQGQSLRLGFREWAKEHHSELKTLGKKSMPQK